MSRAEQLLKAVKSLSSSTPDIEAAAVIDNDGLSMASALPADIDDDAVAAMSAAMLGIGERIARELGRGEFEMVMVRGTKGYQIMTRCGPNAVLAVLAGPKAKLGLIFLDVSRSAIEIARLIG